MSVLSHREFFHGKFGLLLRGMPAATESRHPTYDACWVFSLFHNAPNSDMDSDMTDGIFNVRTAANVCDRTRGFTDTVRESAPKVDSGRNIPCRTEESNLSERHASPTHYQLSYILAPADSLAHLSLLYLRSEVCL